MLSDIGSIASIIALPLSIWALIAVSRLRKKLRERAIDSRVRNRFYALRAIPNRRLTSGARRDMASLIKDLQDFYLPASKTNNAEARIILDRIKNALQEEPDVKSLKDDFELLENIILNHERL